MQEKRCWTALHWACKEGHSEIVDKLIDHGADVNAEDVSFVTQELYS